MTLTEARYVVLGLCIAILAAAFILVAAKAYKAVCEGRREALALAGDRAAAKADRSAGQAGRHRTDPFAAVDRDDTASWQVPSGRWPR